MNHTLPKNIFRRGKGYAVRYTVPSEVRSENGSGIVDHGSGGDVSRCGRSKSRPVSALSVLISGGREHFHR
ncbi:hypothetical protein, partial [Tropicimonas sp. IMCC6043]|uniref:hypothetical protein n=1 Tax=Tropicimonas sp. IMCC6043 TaxID=2510645 RepID=UPI001A91E773